jgi:hypothetical protein
MTTYNDITSRSLTPSNAARRTFPIEILNAVLNMDMGELLEMRHLLVNPKYKEVWGKSYTTELGRLAQAFPASAKAPTPSFSSHAMKFLWTASRTSHMDASVQTIVPKWPTQIARDSPLAATDSTSPETAERPQLTWSR